MIKCVVKGLGLVPAARRKTSRDFLSGSTSSSQVCHIQEVNKSKVWFVITVMVDGHYYRVVMKTWQCSWVNVQQPGLSIVMNFQRLGV